MFIEITRNKLVIDASKSEWREIQENLNVDHSKPTAPVGELWFAIHTILQQEGE